VGSLRRLVQEAAVFADQAILRRQDRPLLLLARLLHQDAHPPGRRRTSGLPLWSRNGQVGSELSNVRHLSIYNFIINLEFKHEVLKRIIR